MKLFLFYRNKFYVTILSCTNFIQKFAPTKITRYIRYNEQQIAHSV